MRKRSPINAFTLIELVVVIGIVGLMVAIPAIAFGQVASKGRDTRRKQDIDKVNTAVQQYRSEYGHYPIQTSYAALAADVAPVYINKLPQDPRNSGIFVYTYESDLTGQTFTLGAVMEKMVGSENERYYSTPGGGQLITGTPIPPTTFLSPTGPNPLSVSPTPSRTPTPSYTPTPTP